MLSFKQRAWLLSILGCIAVWTCAAPAPASDFSFRILPSEISASVRGSIVVTLELENHSDVAHWVGTGVGSPGTRGIPYQSFFPAVRPDGERGFFPTSLNYVFVPSEPEPEGLALSKGLIHIIGAKEVFRFTTTIDVAEMLKQSIGAIKPGTYDLMFTCDPGHAPGEGSFREKKMPTILTSNTILLKLR